MLMALAAGAVALVLAIGAWHAGRPPEPPPVVVSVASTVVSSPTAGAITVYVTGEVVAPGLVAVPVGSRVADAVAAAGGATAGAILSALNLAAPVDDGAQIVVPSAAHPAPTGGESASVSDGRVAINRASVDELQQLPGVGPVLAERIAEYRDAFGPFSAVEDLLDVPGIGEGKLASLRDAVLIP